MSSVSAEAEQLKLLAIFHYILAGVGFLFACFPIIHLVFGLFIMFGSGFAPAAQQGPPMVIGVLFTGLATILILVGWTAAICTAISGRRIAERRNRMFSLIVAGVLCVFMPLGTILGVFTIIVLTKEGVKRLYGEVT
ncbi:MAG: hypothetical protein JNK85_00890 [Verrucomicrobiales bacterium]|nr:hypothetical protein [Verrucomicrobiales bacterium]